MCRRLWTPLAVLVLWFPMAATAQTNFSGTWALNAAASDLSGMKPPKSDVITIQQLGMSFAWSEVIVLRNGSVEKEAWRGRMDGVARPVEGPPGAMASYKQDGSGRWTSPEGNSDLSSTVSADGKQFILTSTSPLPDGKSMTQRFVYDRIK